MRQLARSLPACHSYAFSLATSPIFQVSLLLGVVSLIYAPSLNGYFHGDDFVALVDVASKPPLIHLRDVMTFEDNNYYWRPLGQAYYRLIYELAGLNAFWFRVANLGVFLTSLALVYKLATRLGLQRGAALGTLALVGLFANHPVSVAWISNGGRLLAALFFILCLLTLHQALSRRSLVLEFGAWLSFVAACFSDEITIAMAPIPVAFAAILFWRREGLQRTAIRALAYGTVLALLLPLQFMFTVDDEWRLSRYYISTDIAQQTWALASQLVLPLTGADPMDVRFDDVPWIQWAAGGGAIALGAAVVLFGSGLMRLLVLWIGASLAPFTLWDFDVVSPRYTFMAAFPAAILAPLLVSTLYARLREPIVRKAALVPVTGILIGAVAFGAVATIKRNQDFERAIVPYQTAAARLKDTVPEIAPGTRVLVYDGIWTNQDLWLQAMIRTLYGDASLTAVNIPARVPALEPQTGRQDLILYYVRGELSRQKPLAAR